MRTKQRRLLHVEELESRLAPSTFYVASIGSDGNAGTRQAPFATMQHAMMSLEPGDILNVEPGSYDGFIVGWDDPTRADQGDPYGDIIGTAIAPITIQADPSAAKGSVIINAQDNKTRYGIDIEPGCSYVNLIGFAIADTGQITSSSGRGGGIKIASPNCEAIGNTITNIVFGFGIIADNANNVVLQYNTISGTGSEGDADFGHGIYLSGTTDGAVVQGNVIHDNDYIGIHVNGDLSEGGTGMVRNALIADNMIYNNGQNGINADGLQSSLIENNLIYDYQGYGICLYQIDAAAGSTNNVIVNNTITSTVNGAGAAVRILDGGTGNTVLNNILLGGGGIALDMSTDSMSGLVSNYNLGGGVYQNDDTGNTQTLAQWRTQTGLDAQSSIATATQLFLNAAANSYQLSATSPAINAGTSTDAPRTDINGNPRPSGGGYDIGAYEYGPFDPATHFAVGTPNTAPEGSPFNFTIIALDQNNNPVGSAYSGTVHFSSTDGFSVLPSNTTLINGTGTFSATLNTPGAQTISVSDTNNNGITGSAVLTVTGQATQLIITNLSPTSVTAGGTVTFKVTAADSNGLTVPGYTGTVQLSSTDKSALFNASPVPANYAFVGSDGGSHTFTVTLQSAGTETITVTDQGNKSLTVATTAIIVNAGPLSKYAVNVLGGNTVVAGDSFVYTVQATDQFGNPVSGVDSISTVAPADPLSSFFPMPDALNSSGFGIFLGNLKTAGAYTVTTTAGPISDTSASITVTPSSANYFTVATPKTGVTGSPFNVTVTAFDHFGNIATGYTGSVKITSTDPAAAVLVSSYSFTTGASGDNGAHTFSATLKTGGTQTISATDTVSTNPIIGGVSGAITTRGLVVSAFTPTATGFSVTFDKPFVSGDLTLFGSNINTMQDVTLTQIKDSTGKTVNVSIIGSLIVDPTNTTLTFKATSNFLAAFFGTPILPDGTFAVNLVSGTDFGALANGFFDLVGTPMDGTDSGGQANYATTFMVANSGTTVLSIPDFARGPDGAHSINVPNDSGTGIPSSLYNASGVTDVTFTVTYNPSLLNITGVSTIGAPTGSAFTLVSNSSGVASFHFSNATPQFGTVLLGDILADVPNGAASTYKATELLQLGDVTLNKSAFTGVVSAAVHVNAYFGDVTGNGLIDGIDAVTAYNVARGIATGFAAYPVIDPAIGGDVALDYSVDAGDVSDLEAFTVHLPTPTIPAIPMGLTITPQALTNDPVGSMHPPALPHVWPAILHASSPPHPSSLILHPSFEIRNLPLLDGILYRSSPSQLAADSLFLELGQGPGAGLDFNPPTVSAGNYSVFHMDLQWAHWAPVGTDADSVAEAVIDCYFANLQKCIVAHDVGYAMFRHAPAWEIPLVQ